MQTMRPRSEPGALPSGRPVTQEERAITLVRSRIFGDASPVRNVAEEKALFLAAMERGAGP